MALVDVVARSEMLLCISSRSSGSAEFRVRDSSSRSLRLATKVRACTRREAGHGEQYTCQAAGHCFAAFGHGHFANRQGPYVADCRFQRWATHTWVRVPCMTHLLVGATAADLGTRPFRRESYREQ